MPRVPYISRDPDYKDLDLDMFKNPKTKQLILKEGPDAIKRSVRNLIMTNFNERPFQPYIGSDVRKLLFENFTPVTTLNLEKAIISTLGNFEPRIKLDNVNVTEDIDNNGFNVTIEYTILNKNLPVVTSLFLERIR